MYDRLLAPLDGSDMSEGVLPHVGQLAKDFGATVTLLYAAPVDQASGGNPSLTRSPSGVQSSVAEYLASAAQPLEASGVDVRTRVVHGNPASEIARIASDERFDLIAMATHGRSSVGRWVFGSTTDKVVQASAVPLLVRRPRKDDGAAPMPLRQLVVPLDGSGLAEAVLPHVEELAVRMGLPIKLVRVVPAIAMALSGADPYSYDPKLFDYVKDSADEHISMKRDELDGKGLDVTCGTAHGYPPNQIIDMAERAEGSLIVMSTHGRSGVGRWVLGSVADRVVRASHRPVLLIRPEGSAA